MTETTEHTALMRQGAELHRSGQLEQALLCFERARQLQPGDANTTTACATLLLALDRPEAAYQALLPVQSELMRTADGAVNLAIAAEAAGQVAQAVQAYDRALQLDPDHARALNNTAILAARQGDVDLAVDRMRRCLTRMPDAAQAHANLVDMLFAARRFDEAGALLQQACQRFPADDGLAVRWTLCLAFSGRLDEAQATMAALAPRRLQALRQMLTAANTASAQHLLSLPRREPDAYDLFCQQAFEAHQQCDWRDHARLTAVLREMLGRAQRTGQTRDWRDAQFYGLMLPLAEDEMLALRTISMNGIAAQLPATMRPYQPPRRPQADGRIHVGIAPANLRDPRVAMTLLRQARGHDRARYALHVYASSPIQDRALADELVSLGIPLVEIGHMSNDEAVGRIRLDGLDIFMDAAFNTPWCRPEIVERRVAPVQVRQISWHRPNPPRQCDYNLSDRVIHPDELDFESHGAVVRLPRTLWLAADDTEPDAEPVDRRDAGLPEGAFVMACFTAPVLLDPQTFAAWMKVLQAVPRAVLWLAGFPPVVRRHLAREAQAAGVDPARLCYLPPGTRARTLARIRMADLFVDTLRFNAAGGLSDALRMGVPAVACAGAGMASRIGASIVTAAGLADWVCASPKAYVERIVRAAGDPASLSQARQQLTEAGTGSALFAIDARLREWEWAWAEMVRRHREGLPASAFDVPA